MALVIRYRCHGCGAHVEAQGRTAWVRCSYCRALVGYDWQAWFESPEYIQWLRDYPAKAPRFADLQSHMDAARGASRQGQQHETELHLRRAVELTMELLPQNYPPEIQRDPGYRGRYIRYDVWVRYHWMTDPTIASLDAEVMTLSRATDFSNPLPTVEKLLALQRRQFSRLESLPGGEDPDGMPPGARARLALSSLVSAYLPWLTPEQRLELLRGVHGVNNVREAGEPPDELGFHIDWQCPRCGLHTLQGRGALVGHCYGCFYKGPIAPEASELSEAATRCGSCGHPATMSPGQLEVACSICGASVRRLARTDSAFRDYILDSLSAQGFSLPRLPEDGIPGLPVTDDNRQELVLAGLARQANQLARIVQPSRYVELIRRSLPELSDSERAARLHRIAQLSAAEHGDEAARKLLEEARALLLHPRDSSRRPG